MRKKLLSLILCSVALGFLSCDLLTVNSEGLSEYPTVYAPLDRGELNSLNEQYQQENEGHICSTLNAYGFTGFSELFFVNGESPCAAREVVRIEMTNTDTLEQAAKRTLVKNSDYTGVVDSSELKLLGMEPLPGCTICEGPDENRVNIEYKLTFGNQVVDSAEVLDTEITVFMDAEGVNRIWGNWFAEFKRPEFVTYGYLEVQQQMVGWQIDMRSYTGEEVIYVVKEEDIESVPAKAHVQNFNEANGKLELRTCWVISIDYPDSQSFGGWVAYVDIEDGFLVKLDKKSL